MTLRRGTWSACASMTVLAIASSSAFAGVHGTYLLSPDMSSIVGEYGNLGMGMNPIVYEENVTDSVKSIAAGKISFNFDTYVHQDTTSGGVALAGGFDMAAGVSVKDGFSLNWVQAVQATNVGPAATDIWNLPGAWSGYYPDIRNPPDGNGANDPFYPFQTTPAGGAGLEEKFQDFPRRGFAGGAQSWFAQLALVAVSDTPTINMMGMMFYDVRVIGSFVYGFDFVDVNGDTVISGIGEVQADPAPLGWGPATPSFIDTMNEFYDGAAPGDPVVASGKYKFSNNSNAFIPTPATLALLAAGGVFASRRRRA